MLNEAGAILGGWTKISPEIQKLVEEMTLMTASQRPSINQILQRMRDLYPWIFSEILADHWIGDIICQPLYFKELEDFLRILTERSKKV